MSNTKSFQTNHPADVKGQRIETSLNGIVTFIIIALFWWLFGGLLYAKPGTSIRFFEILPALIFIIGQFLWIVCLIIGIR